MTLDAGHPNYRDTDALVRRLKPRLKRPIVLVGMMGVGKSTVGRKLATALASRFADADEEIVKAANMSIADIFDDFGEDYFRDGERRVIARMMEDGLGVIATGGGAFVQPETRSLILNTAIPVWLDADIETLVERVSRNDKRPLLRGGNVRDKVIAMKAERESAYAQAPIKVMSDRGPHDAAVQRILEALDQWL